MKAWFALFAVLLLATPAMAEDKVRITADSFTVAEDQSLATFSGSVVVIQADMTVHADKVVVHYGAGGPSDIDTLEATGSLIIDAPDQKVTGSRGVYDPKTRIMTVTGNVKVVSSSGTVTGPSLEVDFNAHTTRFAGGGNGRVTGVFNP